jgi:stage II sporulation protein D
MMRARMTSLTRARALGAGIVAVLAAAAWLEAQPASPGNLRVMLAEDAGSVEIRPESPGTLTDFDSGVVHPLAAGETFVVRPGSAVGIRFGTWDLGSHLRYASSDGEGIVALNGKRYRGNMFVERDEDALRIVNDVGVEEYLYSVLGKEMSPEWPMEALKAQAVISRTFALKNLGRNDDQGYDLLDDVRSQVYGGVATENPRAIEAVKATEDQVLVYKGQLVETHFHACCGGHTSAVVTAWKGTRWERPLQGVRDSFCAHAPHFRWKKAIPSTQILGILPQNDRPYKKLKKITIGRRDVSGYVRVLKFLTDEGTVRMRASDLRAKLGPDVLRSTYLTKIAVRKGVVQFAGRGWGHGVGLCQWGTRVQAKRGRKYKNILKFYYPGTKVVPWQA